MDLDAVTLELRTREIGPRRLDPVPAARVRSGAREGGATADPARRQGDRR